MDYIIKYRVHWCGPCEQYGDWKTETIIKSDGRVFVKIFDHHGTNGHYRVVERAVGLSNREDAETLYKRLMNLVYRHQVVVFAGTDAEAEIIIEQPGLRIQFDAGLSYEDEVAMPMVEDYLQPINLCWESGNKDGNMELEG